MAARKPSITRTRRTKKTPEPETTAPQQDASDDISTLDIIEVHLRNTTTHFGNIATVLNTRLEEIVNLLTERNAPGPDNTVLDGFVAKLAAIEAKFNQIPVSLDLSPIIKRLDALEARVKKADDFAFRQNEQDAVEGPSEPAKRRGRPPKVLDTTIQQPAEQKPAPKTEVAICKHIGTLENLQRPGLARCTACGAIVDVPVEMKGGEVIPRPDLLAAQQTVAVPVKANPAAETAAQITAANGKIPTADDVRAVAITFAGKHGKPALADALKEFGATNLSTLPEENRAGLMAKLQAGI